MNLQNTQGVLGVEFPANRGLFSGTRRVEYQGKEASVNKGGVGVSTILVASPEIHRCMIAASN